MMCVDKVAQYYNRVYLLDYKKSIESIVNAELLLELGDLNDAYENSHYDYEKLAKLIDVVEEEILKRMSAGHE